LAEEKAIRNAKKKEREAVKINKLEESLRKSLGLKNNKMTEDDNRTQFNTPNEAQFSGGGGLNTGRRIQQNSPAFGMISQEALFKRVQDLEAKLANKANAAVAPKNVSAPRYEGNSDFYQYLKKFNIFSSAMSWGPADFSG
jgi:uncharacterized protein YfkK (UPF0435 family)